MRTLILISYWPSPLIRRRPAPLLVSAWSMTVANLLSLLDAFPLLLSGVVLVCPAPALRHPFPFHVLASSWPPEAAETVGPVDTPYSAWVNSICARPHGNRGGGYFLWEIRERAHSFPLKGRMEHWPSAHRLGRWSVQCQYKGSRCLLGPVLLLESEVQPVDGDATAEAE